MKHKRRHGHHPKQDGLFRIVVLLSGRGSNYQAIMDKIQAESLPIKVEAVISNRADAAGLLKAKAEGIPAIALPRAAYPDRDQFDLALRDLIDQYEPDLVVLAGFLHVLNEAFVHHFYGRIINLHPSLLPKHKGLHAHRQAMAAGDKKHGATVHFVSPLLDEGPIIAQSACDISPDDTIEAVRARVLVLEHALYPQVIQWILEQRVLLDKDNQVWLDGVAVSKVGVLFDGNTGV
jgi:phosphoribosylglycinamide formyltransferase-1